MEQPKALASVAEIRDRARKHIEEGAVTDEYTADSNPSPGSFE